MTAIFISHSSADHEAAARMKSWLESQGHNSLFLDFDPAAGIRAGASWEQTLYRKLRQCQAVIALVSPQWVASRWCFAEMVQARERGKAIFVVKVEEVNTADLFPDIQHIDLTARPEEGYERLRMGLLERGLDPLDVFDWSARRPPYPGLLAFEEEDAAIFFGRGEALAKSLEALDALRRQSGEVPRFVLMLGASGSGKSSLARAGILPRLKKRQAEWLPLPPMRPQLEPLDELAAALSMALGARGVQRDWHALRQILQLAAEAASMDGSALLGLTRDLATAARQPDTTVLLCIDQAEELFGYTPAPAAERFLRLLRAALEIGDRRLMVMATLRSDFLGAFQNHPALQDKEWGHHLRYRALTVDPMPLRSVPEIIRGPAHLVGLELEDGLVEVMVGDMGAEDALPLLAFTLRRIYERAGAGGRLTLADYESVGRLDGAVRQEAERIVGEAGLVADDMEALHAAFVPMLVGITTDGSFVRRRAVVEHLPRRVLALLKRFVDARLLVSDRDAQGRETHEVAHEALLRTWPQLSRWLEEDKTALRLLEGLYRAAADWQQSGRSQDLLVHRDGRLRDVEALLASPRFSLLESSIEHAYLDACRQAQQAREEAARAEQERRVHDAERIAQEQIKAAAAQRRAATIFRRLGIVASVLFVVALAAAVIATGQYREAMDANGRVAEVQHLSRHTGDPSGSPQRSLLLSVRAALLGQDDPAGTLMSLDLLRQQLRITAGLPLKAHEKSTRVAAFSHDRRWLATGSEDGGIRLWNLTAADPTANALRIEGHQGPVGAMVFSADGRWLISGGSDAAVRLWRLESLPPQAGPVFPVEALGPVRAMALSPDGKWLAFGTQGGHLCVWRMSAAGPEATPCTAWKDDAPVMEVRFSPGGRWLATTCTGACKSYDAPVRLWEVSGDFPASAPRLLVHRTPLEEASLSAMAFSRDDSRLAVAYGYVAEVWDLSLPDPPAPAMGPFRTRGGWVQSLALSPDNRWLALGGGSSADVLLFDLQPGAAQEPVVLAEHSAPILTLGFSDDGHWLASGSADATARLWDMSKPTMPSTLLRGHDLSVKHLLFSPGADPGHVLTWGDDPQARLWRIPDPWADPLVLRAKGSISVAALAVSADGQWLAASNHGDARLRLWSIADVRKPVRELDMPGSSHAIAFSADGRWLAAKNQDKGVISLWSLKDLARAPLTLEEGDWGDLRTLAFSPDGRWLVSGTWNKNQAARLNLWDVSGDNPSLEPLHRCELDSPVRMLSFSTDGRLLGTAEHQRVAHLWNLAATNPCEQPRVLPHGNVVYQVVMSNDGRWAATASFDGKGRLWDLKAAAEPKQVREILFKDRVTQAAFSPDSQWVAFGAWDNRAALLSLKDVGTAVPLFLSGHAARLHATVFSPDSRWLATSSEDRTLRLWDLSAPRAAPLVLRGHEATVAHVGFTRDGRWLASGAYDGTVRLWQMRLADLVATACRTAGRPLTSEEVEQFMPHNSSALPCTSQAKGTRGTE
jgi:WD40 repeat protein